MGAVGNHSGIGHFLSVIYLEVSSSTTIAYASNLHVLLIPIVETYAKA